MRTSPGWPKSQTAASAALRQAIPEAKVSRSFRVLVNGLTVELPATRLPALARLGFVTKIYPSLRYSVALNRSPAVMAASTYTAATGARGTGIKIGVVDDGVDPANPFFAPAGFQYPAGFPKGGRQWTSPKVIVARAFPGPGSGRRGRLAIDPRASFHGTHVAGIAAGNAGTTSTGGRDHPPVTGLSGIAPNAWIGNYRVFNVPTAIGNTAQTPEIVAAFEAAVRDGMNVINFSGGGPMTDPDNDALVEAVSNVSAAGVVPVISAGNDRDDFGIGSVGAPGVAPDSIAVAALSNTHAFGPALTVAGRVFNYVPAAGALPPAAFGTSDRALVDIGTVVGRDGRPVDRLLCATGSDPNAARTTAAARLARGRDRTRLAVEPARSSPRRCGHRRRARSAWSWSTTAPARPTNPVQAAVPGRHDLRPRRGGDPGDPGRARRPSAGPPGTRARPARERAQRCRHELLLGWPDRIRPSAEARRRRAGRRDPLLDDACVRRAVRGLRRDEHGRTARRGSSRAAARSAIRPGRHADAQVRDRQHGWDGLGQHGAGRRKPRCCSPDPGS